MNNVTCNLDRMFRKTAIKTVSWALMIGLMTISLLTQETQAGLIATNGDVPTTMDAGGTVSDVALYLYDGYTTSLASFCLGSGTSYNSLDIVNGSAIEVTNTSWSTNGKVVGHSSSTGHNSLRVSGTGTSLTIASGGLAYTIGYQSDYNSMTVENGATVTSTGNLYFGGNAMSGSSTAGGSYNSIAVNGATVNVGRTYIGMFSGSTGNTVSVTNSGVMTASRLYVGYDSSAYSGSTNNDVTADGAGSIFESTGGFYVGYGSDSATGNTATAINGGLLKQSYTGNFSVSADNYIRLGGGYLALNGNRTTALTDNGVLVWNGSDWVAGVQDSTWTATYYADEADALAATGYSGLGGYTIFTGGVAIPEPTTMMVLLSGMTLAVLRRRQR